MSRPIVVDSVATLRAQIRVWREEGLRIAMVPTMGALHDGHISLVRIALETADRCLVSIFVNPTQFAPTEDLDNIRASWPAISSGWRKPVRISPLRLMLPRCTRSDLRQRFRSAAPPPVSNSDFRPTFFDGVATVVAKLFLQTLPDYAIFGEKDYQQLCVVRQLCRDLDLPVEIIGAPTVRDAHGLAMSSRNAYLGEAELEVARKLNAILRRTASALTGSADEAGATDAAARALVEAGFQRVDYVAARESLTLAPWRRGRDGRLLAAAWLGKTRLIDNVEIPSA